MTEGQFPKGTGNYNLYASEVNAMEDGRKVLAIGQFTIANTTTAYDTASNYADISITAGQLNITDQIYIEVFGQNQDNAVDIGLRVDINDVTSTATGLEVTYNEQVTFKNQIILRQHASTTDLIRGHLNFFKSDSAYAGGTTTDYDTDDSNIFATAFTIRLNGKYSSSASSSTIIYYVVYRDTLTS